MSSVTDDEIEAASIVLAERKPAEFLKQAWSEFEGTEYKPNYHIDCILEHCQAVIDGQIKNLVINIPPGCCKSICTSVITPVWGWIRNPSLRFACYSYDQGLALRDAVKSRQILESNWFTKRWSHKVSLKVDENQKGYYGTTKNGTRLSTAIGSRTTGEHPDIIIADDPHSAAGAESKKLREEVIDWYRMALSTRGVSRGSRRIICAQRFHVLDLSGYVLENEDDVVHLMFPMRFEKGRMKTTVLGWADPRENDGELLWPSLFDDDKVTKLERKLGEYGTAGQLQQRPTLKEGGKFKDDGFVPAVTIPQTFVVMVRMWDAAGSFGEGDYTVGSLLGLGSDGQVYVLDVIREQLDVGQRDQKIKATADIDGKHVVIGLPKDPGAAGIAQMAYWQRMLAGYDVRFVPMTSNKEVRASPLASAMFARNVKWIQGPWMDAVKEEMKGFPNWSHDDVVDSLSDGYSLLTEIGKSPINVDLIKRFTVSGRLLCTVDGSIDERILQRLLVVCADSVSVKPYQSNGNSSIMVVDFYPTQQAVFLRYGWSENVTWKCLVDKVEEIGRLFQTHNAVVIGSDVGKQLIDEMANGNVKGIVCKDWLLESPIELIQPSLLQLLQAGKIYTPDPIQVPWVQSFYKELAVWSPNLVHSLAKCLLHFSVWAVTNKQSFSMLESTGAGIAKSHNFKQTGGLHGDQDLVRTRG